MHVNSETLRKADSGLVDALRTAQDEQRLQAILVLGARGGEEVSPSGPAPDPQAFDSHADYRRALLDARRSSVAATTGDVLARLKALALEVYSSDLGQVVTVAGPARAILSALALPGVRSGSIDRELRIGNRGRAVTV